MALPHGAVGWSAVCDCGIHDHTHLLFYNIVVDVELFIFAVEVPQDILLRSVTVNSFRKSFIFVEK